MHIRLTVFVFSLLDSFTFANVFKVSSMEERTKKTLEECKKLELKLSEAEKDKKNVEKKYAQVLTDLLPVPMHLLWKLCKHSQILVCKLSVNNQQRSSVHGKGDVTMITQRRVLAQRCCF